MDVNSNVVAFLLANVQCIISTRTAGSLAIKDVAKSPKASKPASDPDSTMPAPEAPASKSNLKGKITIYLRLSNVKALHTFCEVELQVWLFVVVGGVSTDRFDPLDG